MLSIARKERDRLVITLVMQAKTNQEISDEIKKIYSRGLSRQSILRIVKDYEKGGENGREKS